jgi:hypothetical protein
MPLCYFIFLKILMELAYTLKVFYVTQNFRTLHYVAKKLYELFVSKTGSSMTTFSLILPDLLHVIYLI